MYVCGASPVWLVQTERGGLRLHPARYAWVSFTSAPHALACSAAVPVWAFAPFNTPSGPYGFITLDTTDTFNVCKLPEGVMLEMPWLTRRVPLRRTPYFVTYNRDLLHYVVVRPSAPAALCLTRARRPLPSACRSSSPCYPIRSPRPPRRPPTIPVRAFFVAPRR